LLQEDSIENIDLDETENICIIDLNSLGGDLGEAHINLSGINPGRLPELKILGLLEISSQ